MKRIKLFFLIIRARRLNKKLYAKLDSYDCGENLADYIIGGRSALREKYNKIWDKEDIPGLEYSMEGLRMVNPLNGRGQSISSLFSEDL